MTYSRPLPRAVETTEYRRTKTLLLSCTQLGPEYNAAQRAGILNSWLEFFSHPHPLRELWQMSHTPDRLFQAICQCSQLEGLCVKWGQVKNLLPLASLTGLRRLYLGNIGVTQIEPIGELSRLRLLCLRALYHVRDYSGLGSLSGLEELWLSGDENMPKKIQVNSLAFLSQMQGLRRLKISGTKLNDGKWEAVCSLGNLEYLDLPPLPDATRALILKRLPKLKAGNVVSGESSLYF